MIFFSTTNVNKRIDRLYELYEVIVNFDELYSKIMESYQHSKQLIQEQILAYDKKIIQNTSNMDARLGEFRAILDHAIDDTFAQNRQWLSDQKNVFEKVSQDARAALKELSDQYLKNSDEKLESLDQAIEQHFEDVNSRTSVLLAQMKDLMAQTNEQWNAKLNATSIELQKVLERYEINLYEMIRSIVDKRINQVIIDDIVIQGTEKILHSFNKSLVELKQTERDTIINAIQGLINQHLVIVDDQKISRRPINPIRPDELFHRNHDKLKSCIEAGTRQVPVIPMIVGPAGTGKSTAVEQIAREMNLHFYMANRIQNTFELVGFVDASGTYVTTQFYEAFTKGGIFLFDEVDASSPEALVTINAALAQGYMAFPGHPNALDMHPDFKVVCAGNTFGTGSTLAYTGRNKLDAATLDRFMIIEWDYDTELEDKLVKDKDLLQFCWKLRRDAARIDKSIIVSTRGIITLEKLFEHNKKTNAFSGEEILKQKFFETIKADHIKELSISVGQSMDKNPYYPFLEALAR